MTRYQAFVHEWLSKGLTKPADFCAADEGFSIEGRDKAKLIKLHCA